MAAPSWFVMSFNVTKSDFNNPTGAMINAPTYRTRILTVVLLIAVSLPFASGCPRETMNGASLGAAMTSDSDPDSAGSPLPIDAELVQVVKQGTGDVAEEVVGEFIRLTAEPAEGWRFDGWEGEIESVENPLVVSAAVALTVTAVFTQVDGTEAQPSSPAPDGGQTADSDGDGALDEVDRCPGTPAGRPVDAAGCTDSQRDDDRDGVDDSADVCPETPRGADVDDAGCAATQRDSDQDGVADADDLCPATAVGTVVLTNGCTAIEADTDGDRVPNHQDRCPQTPVGSSVNSAGCRPGELPFCGNGTLEPGEQCDPPSSNTCDNACRNIGPAPSNDSCSSPTMIQSASTAFDNTAATTTGSIGVASTCDASDFQLDVWFCYAATCTGSVSISLCPGDFDTMLAVYDGCTCPTRSGLGCNDDGCNTFGAGSQLVFPAVAGQGYLVRVGGWQGDEGRGTILISCTGLR